MSRSSRIPLAALAALALALTLALALSLRGGSGSGTAFRGRRRRARRGHRARSAHAHVQRLGRCRAAARHGGRQHLGARRRGHQRRGPGGRETKMKAVLAALRTLDSRQYRRGRSRTQGVSTSRDWEHEGRFLSDQSLSVTIHDPARSGTVIAAATAAGADSVDGPSFSLAEQSAAYRDALRKRARRRSLEGRRGRRGDGRAHPRHQHDQRVERRRPDHVRGRRCRGQGLRLRAAGAGRPRDVSAQVTVTSSVSERSGRAADETRAPRRGDADRRAATTPC